MSEPGFSSTQTLPTIDHGPRPGPDPYDDGQDEPVGPRRFWSPRRLPAALVAAAFVVASAVLLYDIAAVRAGRPAQEWRRRVADDLATRPLDSVWIIGGGAVAAVLGLGLLWLACTPGLRAVLAVRPSSYQVRAGLDRKAAELVLRDTVLQVPGLSAARVKVSRRRAKVRAYVRFRDLDSVRDELDEALADGMDSLGLIRPLVLTLVVRHESGR